MCFLGGKLLSRGVGGMEGYFDRDYFKGAVEFINLELDGV